MYEIDRAGARYGWSKTEIKVVDPDSGNVVPPGIKGSIKVRGRQVMKGYYKVYPLSSSYVDCARFSVKQSNLRASDSSFRKNLHLE